MTILLAHPDQQVVSIPGWVTDLASFRRWACSDEFPETGQYSHLDGLLWVDGSMEKRAHNRLKTGFSTCLDGLANATKSGEYYGDGMLMTNLNAALSNQPDGMFISYETLRAGNLTFVKGFDALGAVGCPDMVLEVVSPTSRQKDTVILRDLYHRAEIAEYWLVDPMRWEDLVTFDILRWQPDGYASVAKQDGWIESKIFQRSFRLSRGVDPLGNPSYQLEIR